MLAIRFQRVGRKNHAEFRVVVQEARRSPSSGRIVAQVGHYNPHTKATTLDKEKAAFYLNNGAQPSPRVAGLFKNQGVELPSWVRIDTSKNRSIKNADKLRRNKPAEAIDQEPAVEVAQEAPTEAEVVEEIASETAVAEPAAEKVEA
ncbi:30S ribosomal protein S16 [bacterium]|nr:30S ribosomal protein S16 [bacterium]NBX98605.1 30S ribosomal protein S16 [bacterium]NDC94698.1 30S ribosomal protein S16 [bacterium]NDD84228.1 30S ribosomal protein S16 [bacterium]NDG30145.1 30S ribosomal protein S16 [bacterium]